MWTLVQGRQFRAVFCTLVSICFWVGYVCADDPVIRRTTLLVSDAKASLAFYELLGFREWLDWSGDQDPNDPTALPLTGEPSNSRIIIMAGDNDYSGMIGLLEFDSPPLAANRIDPNKIGVKDIILMIEADDVQTLHGHLIAAGHPIVRPPGQYKSDGPAGSKRGYNMLVRDPDGYIVEVTDVQSRD